MSKFDQVPYYFLKDGAKRAYSNELNSYIGHKLFWSEYSYTRVGVITSVREKKGFTIVSVDTENIFRKQINEKFSLAEDTLVWVC